MPAPKKTARQKKLDGNPGKRSEPIVVQPPPGVPEMPEYLGPIARAEWDRVVSVLDKMGVISVLDRAALADYCVCVERLQDATSVIADQGLLIEGDRGFVKNPVCQLEREYRAALMGYCSLFGFAPGPRGRMEVPESTDKDEDPEGLLD